MALTMGLGCRNMVGNQAILSKNKEFRKALHFSRSDRIFGLVGVGHPSVVYRNKVEGRQLPVQWNGDSEPCSKMNKERQTPNIYNSAAVNK
jgi:hypothetical protein